MAPRKNVCTRLVLLGLATTLVLFLVVWQRRSAERISTNLLSIGRGSQRLILTNTGQVIRLNKVPSPHHVDKAIVVAKTLHENVAWLHELRPQWTPYVYTAAEPPEAGYNLIPLGHRGREAMAYLTFIVANYDALPNVTAFVHAGMTQRHNDLLGPYTSTILQNIRIDNVLRRGFVNLRCKHDPGCPIAVNPLNPTEIDIKKNDIRATFADVYVELFDVPLSEVPAHVGHVCCGQFVVSRERIRQRSKADYERMVQWALSTNSTNSFGIGWVFEKVWHIVFGMDAA
ncbi:MAG: hypothetical protein M1828_001541 [Chrysothrix sp. TS-e1954]|nr:MAG: hypothetical protein M1828_001541 [Chrysothrix sp. TS-e1954]